MQGVCALMAADTAWLHIVAVHARLVGATVCLALRTTATPVVVVLRAHHNTTNASAEGKGASERSTKVLSKEDLIR